jgi:hypothetical protein
MTLARMNIPNIVVMKREKAPSKSMRPNEEKIKATMNFISEAMHKTTANSHSRHGRARNSLDAHDNPSPSERKEWQ